MLELVTVQIGKFVRNINEKRKETHYSKEWFIKPFGQSDVVNNSVKNMCIRFVTIRRIPGVRLSEVAKKFEIFEG